MSEASTSPIATDAPTLRTGAVVDSRGARAANDSPRPVDAGALVTIVPVHNGGDDLERALGALLHAGQPADAMVVVDDSSTDGRAELVSSRLGTRYLRLDGGPYGPARARNAGAALFPGAFAYLFVDADVTVHADTVQAFRTLLDDEPGVSAAFGSYDDAPPARGWISRYKNLLHHWMHQRGATEASTFWSGCGAVRGDAFRRHGGFDEGFAAASIEDVDLGMRLVDSGERVLLRPGIRCTHWKRWTLRSWLRTDIFARALPWSRLIVSRGRGVPDTLNLGLAERASAFSACLSLACLGLVLVPGLRAAGMLGALVSVTAFCILQKPLIGFFASRGGWAFAVAAAAMHFTYFVYSSVVYGSVVVGARLSGTSPRRRDDRPDSRPDTSSTAFAAGSSNRKSNGNR